MRGRHRRRPVIAAFLAILGFAAAAQGASRAEHAASRNLTVTQRVLRNGDLTAFKVKGTPRVAFDATAFAKLSAEPAEGPKLARAGFTRGVFEYLPGPRGTFAYSLAYEYSSAQSAKSELERIRRKDIAAPGVSVRPLTVPGIPGAKGLRTQVPDGTTQFEVLFADGPYLYYETAIGPPGHPASSGALIRASRKLFARVNGTGDQGGTPTD